MSPPVLNLRCRHLLGLAPRPQHPASDVAHHQRYRREPHEQSGVGLAPPIQPQPGRRARRRRAPRRVARAGGYCGRRRFRHYSPRVPESKANPQIPTAIRSDRRRQPGAKGPANRHLLSLKWEVGSLDRTQEVAGSSPASSMRSPCKYGRVASPSGGRSSQEAALLSASDGSS
jgi:hypothetical protein